MSRAVRERRILVLGLGRFGGGREAVRFLHRRGCPVRVADRSAGPDLEESRALLADLDGVDWQLGREDDGLLADIDAVVVNPAVADDHPLLREARARGITLTQECELFLDAYPGRVIGITGTNGKSTTTMLLHKALERAGLSALVGGNIGHSLLAEEARWQPDQTAVLEISSFQLERLDPARHRLHGAVVTRLGKDHLDRHGSLSAYHAAKARLAAMAGRFLVHAADDPVATAFATPAPRRITFSTAAPPAADRAGVRSRWLWMPGSDGRPLRLLHGAALAMLGDFQWENVLAAGSAALQLGAAPAAVALALVTAEPLPFRLQLLAILDGVRIYDNSVSTEIESTRAALRSLTGPVHWVGGGKSKDGDFQAVADGIAPHVASAHLFGTAADPLGRCLTGRIPASRHERLPEALAAALDAAGPASAVLFSPAFASFDQYPNFRVRAQEFHRWIEARRSGTSPSLRAVSLARTGDNSLDR